MAEATAPHVLVEPRILYFGTPVVLVSTVNEDDTPNLTPMSSAWALGRHIALGLGGGSQGLANLKRTGECVLNLPSDDLWQAVERLAPLTGKNPVPAYKAEQFRYEKDKFGAARLTPTGSQCVRPPRVLECPLHIEARVCAVHPLGPEGGASVAVVEAVRIHAHPDIVAGPHHIDPAAWRPLIYNFRHYYGLGEKRGHTFRAEPLPGRAGGPAAPNRETPR